jgi:hypothetical protein
MRGLLLQLYSAILLLLFVAAYNVDEAEVRVYSTGDNVELESLKSFKSPLSDCLLGVSKPTVSFADNNPTFYTGKFHSYLFKPFSHFSADNFRKSRTSLNHNYIFKASRNIVFHNIRV